MKTTNQRRCVHCTRTFVPDPRVGDRQVTCGDEGCQRARHSEQCRAWHEKNREADASHYQEVVLPFRREQPDYQQRWRLGRRLREIREESKAGSGWLRRRAWSLLRRAEALSAGARQAAQTGVLAGGLLEQAKDALRGVLMAVEQLEVNMSALQSLGL